MKLTEEIFIPSFILKSEVNSKFVKKLMIYQEF